MRRSVLVRCPRCGSVRFRSWASLPCAGCIDRDRRAQQLVLFVPELQQLRRHQDAV